MVIGRRLMSNREEEETIEQFFRRRFGDTITDELVAAMALGIWGGRHQEVVHGLMFSLFGSIREAAWICPQGNVVSSKEGGVIS